MDIAASHCFSMHNQVEEAAVINVYDVCELTSDDVGWFGLAARLGRGTHHIEAGDGESATTLEPDEPAYSQQVDLLPVDLLPVDLLHVDLLHVDLLHVDLLHVDLLPVDLLPVDLLHVDLLPDSREARLVVKVLDVLTVLGSHLRGRGREEVQMRDQRPPPRQERRETV